MPGATIVTLMVTKKNSAATDTMKLPRSISASEFKARCLRLMDDVAYSDEPLLITKNGKLLVQLVSARDRSASPSAFGLHRGLLVPIDAVDLTKPVTDASDWTGDLANIRKRRRAR